MFSIYKLNKKNIAVFSLFLTICCFVGMTIAEDENQFLKSSFTKDGEATRKAFQDVIKQPLKSMFRIQCDGKDVVFGVVVDSNGLAITKASEVHGELTCTFADGRVRKATVVKVSKKQDLGLIQLKKGTYEPVKWSQEKINPKHL